MRYRLPAILAALLLASTSAAPVAEPDRPASANPAPKTANRIDHVSRAAVRPVLFAAHTARPIKPAPRPKQPKRRSKPTMSPKAYARSLVGPAQFRCLDLLWTKESGWNPLAHNPTSGAHGIPQALPGSKMASAGPDWYSNPITQIRWGIGYIKSRYGTPCAAWAHSQAVNWY